MVYGVIAAIILLAQANLLFSSEKQLNPFIKADQDGYAGPRAALPNKHQYCVCEMPSYVCPPGRRMPKEEIISRRYLGATQGEIPFYENGIKQYVDHYKVKTIERGWFNDTYREYDHLHVQGFSKGVVDNKNWNEHHQPKPEGTWYPSVGSSKSSQDYREDGPMHGVVESRQWHEYTGLGKTILVGGMAALSLCFLRRHKSINTIAKQLQRSLSYRR